MPERFKDQLKGLKPEEGTPEHDRLLAIAELHDAESFRDFVKAVDAYRRGGHRFPDDEDLLGRMLDHPREQVLVEVLTHLLDLHRRHTLSGSAALSQRLKTIRSITDDPKIHGLIEELEAVL